MKFMNGEDGELLYGFRTRKIRAFSLLIGLENLIILAV